MFQSSILPLLIGACLLLKYEVRKYENESPGHAVSQDAKPTLSLNFFFTMRTSMTKQKGPVCRNRLVLLYLCSLLLAQSYAPEPNPGPRPIRFPCGVCNKAVRWGTPGVCCDSCDVWYHQNCMCMSDNVYAALKNVSWECFQCGVPASSGLFDTTIMKHQILFHT